MTVESIIICCEEHTLGAIEPKTVRAISVHTISKLSLLFIGYEVFLTFGVGRLLSDFIASNFHARGRAH